MGRETRRDNAATIFALVSLGLVVATGAAIDLKRIAVAHADLRQRIETALAAGARDGHPFEDQTARSVFAQLSAVSGMPEAEARFKKGADGLSGTAVAMVPTTLARLVGISAVRVTASGRATAAPP